MRTHYHGDAVVNGANEILGRVIRKEAKVNASVEKVWKAWTTSEGTATFFAPKARIELTLGGSYELNFDLQVPKGSHGGEGCRLLSFLPMEMLWFEWNAPPQFPMVRKE